LRRKFEKNNDLIKDIERKPFEGLEKPEPFKNISK